MQGMHHEKVDRCTSKCFDSRCVGSFAVVIFALESYHENYNAANNVTTVTSFLVLMVMYVLFQSESLNGSFCHVHLHQSDLLLCS